MNFMLAFGLASIMICIGMILRAKFEFFGKMLIPVSVIAGVCGLLIMNLGGSSFINQDMYVDIVNYLFTITFISIGLTSKPKESVQTQESTGKNVARGSLGLGLSWNILYALTPAVGALIILGVGGFFGMDPVYGLLIPFAFAQGPGQAATFGSIMESEYGIIDAATVGVTFASIGFLVCFLVGVPLIRYGIQKGLAKNMQANQLKGSIKKGYYAKTETGESLGNETTYSGNMDTLTVHFAMIGLCFVMALGMAKLISFIPGIGDTFGGMLFIYGMLAGYFVKFIMRKMDVDHLIDNTFQTKLTGWSTDYLVVASFMAVPFQVIGDWIVPIMIVVIAITIISLIISIYFGQRMGGDHDFERTVGLYGTTTGTVPSGVALVRIVDPALKTTTAVELGLMNVPMMLSFVTVLTIFGIASGTLSLSLGIMLLLAPIPVYLILMRYLKVWGAKTFVFKAKRTPKRELIDVASEK